MHANLRNESGVVKSSKVGFSWTTLFVGFWPALIRGDFKWAGIILAIDIVTMGLGSIVLSFLYNQFYIKELMENGYYAADEFSEEVLLNKGIKVS